MLIDKGKALAEVYNAELWVSYSPDEPIEDIVEEAILAAKRAITDGIEGLPEGVVRCKKCKHWWCLDQLDWDGQCDKLQRTTNSDWYCADGKRRE